MLTKPLVGVFVPGVPPVPARPEVPAQPARTVCSNPPAPGHWEQHCEFRQIPIGQYTYEDYAAGRCRYDQIGQMNYVTMGPICTSVFVPDGPAGPPTCVTYPAVPYQPATPAVPGVPAHTEYRTDFAWNAGANSVVAQAGNFVLRDTMPLVVGVVWGVRPSSERETEPANGRYQRMTHAWYFHQNGAGNAIAHIMESGGVIGAPIPYGPDDLFEIRRAGDVVSYWHAGVPRYTSRKASVGEVMATSAIYGTGDAIP